MSGKRLNPSKDPATSSSNDEDEVETSIGEGKDTDIEGNSWEDNDIEGNSWEDNDIEGNSWEDNDIEGNSWEDNDIEGNPSSEDEDVSSKNPTFKERIPIARKMKQVFDSESRSEEETGSDSEPERKNQVAKGSSVVKPVIETKYPLMKSQDFKKVKTFAKPVAKRSSVEIYGAAAASTNAKRVKRVSGEDDKRSSGRKLLQITYLGVWSEDDEIAVLQGFIDFKNGTGVSPYDDTNVFYQSVKKSISFDVSKIRFMDKLKSLKEKYESNIGKAKNGEEPTFPKSHDRKAFKLSKLIWGANGVALESAVKSNGKSKKSCKSNKVESVKQDLDSSLPNGKSCEDEVPNKGEIPSLGTAELDTNFVKSFLVKPLACFGVDDLAAQQGWKRLASEDKKRFEEQWKALQVKEFEFYSQKSGLIHELLTKMAEAFRSNP